MRVAWDHCSTMCLRGGDSRAHLVKIPVLTGIMSSLSGKAAAHASNVDTDSVRHLLEACPEGCVPSRPSAHGARVRRAAVLQQ